MGGPLGVGKVVRGWVLVEGGDDLGTGCFFLEEDVEGGAECLGRVCLDGGMRGSSSGWVKLF